MHNTKAKSKTTRPNPNQRNATQTTPNLSLGDHERRLEHGWVFKSGGQVTAQKNHNMDWIWRGEAGWDWFGLATNMLGWMQAGKLVRKQHTTGFGWLPHVLCCAHK